MFRFIVNTHFCFSVSTIITRSKNPYLSFHSDQLRQIIKQKLTQKSESIQHINALIQLGIASQNKKMMPQLQKIVQSCMKNLDNIQNIINKYQQHELVQFEMGSLLSILNWQPYNLTQNQAQKLTQLYLNTYCHLFPFSKQLKIYQNSKNHYYLDLVTQVSHQKINKIVQNHLIHLSDYVAYLRLFYHQIKPQYLNQKLNQYKKNVKLCQLTEQQKLTLYFILISLKCDIKLIKQLNLQPSLSIKQKQQSKFTCIKLQILKHKHQTIPDLNIIDLTEWDYSNIIWLSQFSSNQPQFKQKLHSKILLSNLPNDIKPSTIFTYAHNAEISKNKHEQICSWLCQQNRVNITHEQNLCKMLNEIHQHKWEPYYQKFYRLVLKMSLGNFKWESQKTIYYYGAIQHIEDENMEYLRRYILNTYAALGTARKQIPTTSYFYKILGIVNVEKFYKNY